MSVRPFDWRDISVLHRYRHQRVFLDSALLLTRGSMAMSGALISYLAPSIGIFTSVYNGCNDWDRLLIGQAMLMPGAQFAHLTFMTPEELLNSPALSVLVDHLAVQAGERGAFRLLAEVDEDAPASEFLHRSGFAIYSRQRIWQLTGQTTKEAQSSAWRAVSDQDLIAIRSLYYNVVPGLVQQVEPFSTQHPQGMVYQQKDDLLAFVELKYGHHGIWAHPFVHPDAEDVSDLFFKLLKSLPNRHSRPVYLCVRSYQSWLESAIEDLGAESGPRQAVMVKHLAVLHKNARVFALPALEGGHPEISAPIARSESK
jgi:hypothetical protein